jgi:hypothetical protein
MKTGLIKRLRNSIKDLYKEEELLGNIFFNEDGSIFLYDEVSITDADYIDFKILGLNKTIEESWLRFKRAGLLDDLDEEEKEVGWKKRKYARVTYDEVSRKIKIDTEVAGVSEERIKKVKELFNLN